MLCDAWRAGNCRTLSEVTIVEDDVGIVIVAAGMDVVVVVVVIVMSEVVGIVLLELLAAVTSWKLRFTNGEMQCVEHLDI